MNALKLGIEKSGFQGRDDTPKLIAALEGLEMKEGDDFPQGDKTLRKEDHQAFMREFIFEIQDGKYRILEVVPKEKTMVPPACTFRRRLSERPGRFALDVDVFRGGIFGRGCRRPAAVPAHRGADRPLRRADRAQPGQFRGRARRDPRGDRPERSRQEHVLQLPDRRAAADLRAHPVQRRGHHRAVARPHLAKGHRPLVPDHQHPAQRDGARKRPHRRPVAPPRLEHADPSPRLPRHHRKGRGGAGGRSGCAARRRSWPPTCRTASSAISRSASRWRPSRSSCASTSRPPG